MTDEELNAIRHSRDAHAAHPNARMPIPRYVRHVSELLAEVERLQAVEALLQRSVMRENHLADEVDAMREIVQAVTTGEIGDMGYNLAGYCRCDPDLVEHLADDGEWLSTEVVHKPHCLIAKAQALLASE